MRRPSPSDTERADIVTRYQTQSVLAIAEATGFGRSTILRVLHQAQVKMRVAGFLTRAQRKAQ